MVLRHEEEQEQVDGVELYPDSGLSFSLSRSSVNEERVLALAEAIKARTYRIPVEAIADELIQRSPLVLGGSR